LSVEVVATRLKMPEQVIRSLEQEDWQRLGAPVFVRGQLRSYGRLLGVDLEPLLQQAHLAPVEPVKLVSHTHTPKARRIMESAARRAVYVVITAVFVVPAWYAIRHLPDAKPSTASLDVVPGSTPVADAGNTAASPGTDAAAEAGNAPSTANTPSAVTATPYMASLTPMPRNGTTAAAGATSGKALSLRFSDESWIQVLAPDGSTLEQAVVRAGEQRSYDAGAVGRIKLGKASAVEVQQGGSIVDTKPYQRGNVARFAVSSDGSVVPVSE
jgi:cytoskeleton protein RodZ